MQRFPIFYYNKCNYISYSGIYKCNVSQFSICTQNCICAHTQLHLHTRNYICAHTQLHSHTRNYICAHTQLHLHTKNVLVLSIKFWSWVSNSDSVSHILILSLTFWFWVSSPLLKVYELLRSLHPVCVCVCMYVCI